MTLLQRALLKALVTAPEAGAPPLAGSRILAVQIAGMGDFTLAVPAIRALRRAIPSGTLDLLTSEKAKGAALGCPHIDAIETLDARHIPVAGVHPSAGMGEVISLIRKIRRRRYGLAVNLMGLYSPRGAVRMGWLLRSPGIPRLAGRNTLGTGAFYHYSIDEDLAAPLNERDAHLALVRRLGADGGGGDSLETWPSEEEERFAESIARKMPGQGPLIAVNPGTDRPEKDWPEERFLEVMRALRERRSARFLLTRRTRRSGPRRTPRGGTGASCPRYRRKDRLPRHGLPDAAVRSGPDHRHRRAPSRLGGGRPRGRSVQKGKPGPLPPRHR